MNKRKGIGKMHNAYLTCGVGILLLGSLLVSCKKDKRADDARKIVTGWTGKQITFPTGIPCAVKGEDTVCISPSNPAYKILMYVDSAGCTNCKLRLPYWNAIVAEADSLFAGKVDFLFFFQPKDEKELTWLLKRDNFRRPVFVDRENRLDRLNRFPSQMEYRCFLLDSENRVVLVGNPALNPKVWELFKRQIGGETRPARETVRTTVIVETPVQNLGTMKKNNIYTCTYTIRNTGDSPFIIMDVKTSCGCTVPLWEKCPLAPGETTTIKVEVKPDTSGAFRKTVTVYGNAENAPLQLAVMGEVSD